MEIFCYGVAECDDTKVEKRKLMQTWEMAVWTLVAFILGSIPFGSLVAKTKGVDLKSQGSGNTGATNTGRVLGPVYGAFVMMIDALKGGFIVITIRHFYPDYPTLAMWLGTVAVFGHCFSPWLGWNGGKGGSTSLGIALAMHPVIAACCLLLWSTIILLTRYVSLATMIATGCLTVAIAGLTHYPLPVKLLFALLFILSIARHKSNIRRLWKGEESKIFAKNKKP